MSQSNMKGQKSGGKGFTGQSPTNLHSPGFYNIHNNPHAILLQTKEALFPASHIPKSQSSFKPPHTKKQRKPNKLKAKKNTPSTTLDLFEEQIEMAQVMNNKEKQIQQVPIQRHPIIRKPEAISDDEMPDPGAQVQVPQMQPAAQVQVPQMEPAAQVQFPQMQLECKSYIFRCSLKHK